MVTKAQNLPIENVFTNQSKNYKSNVLQIKQKASANEIAIGVFAIQTPQHFTYFG